MGKFGDRQWGISAIRSTAYDAFVDKWKTVRINE
jgi:hypothetical protein